MIRFPQKLFCYTCDAGRHEVEGYNNALVLDSWFVPVSYNSEPRMIIRVQRGGEGWRVSEFGMDPKYIIYARSKWPAKDGYQISYVGVTHGPEFFSIEREGKIQILPLYYWNEYSCDSEINDAGYYQIISFDTMMTTLKSLVNEGKCGHHGAQNR